MFDRMKKAQRPATDYVTLRDLAKSKSARLRAAVGSNPNTQTYVLEELAVDKSEKVRVGVARNKNLSPKAWDKLSENPTPAVKAALDEFFPERPDAKHRRA